MSTTDALPARPVQWSVGEVAEYLGVQPSTVRAYVARGEMPAPDGHVGRSPWWTPETITQWHESRRGHGSIGRPVIGPQLKVRLPEALIARIDAVAEVASLTRSAWIRQALEDALPTTGTLTARLDELR